MAVGACRSVSKVKETGLDMSKFREAVRAGRQEYSRIGVKSRVPYYSTLPAVFVIGLIKLGYAWVHRDATNAIEAVSVWWIIVPLFSWFWFRRRGRVADP